MIARYQFEYVRRSGRLIALPWIVWRLLPKTRRRRIALSRGMDWDALLAAAPPDFPERLADRFNDLLSAELKDAGRLLDWIGVAAVTPFSERVLILSAEYMSRTGQMPLDEAVAMGRQILDAEPWFCRCDGGGYAMPRNASLSFCLVCGEYAPWFTNEPGIRQPSPVSDGQPQEAQK